MRHCILHRKGITGKWQDTISIIRYADDFIAIQKSSDIVLKAKEYISQWLGNIGLELKPSKKPSDDAVKRHSLQLKTTIRNLSPVKQEVLIKELSPIITGWANYYQYSVSSSAFNEMSTMTFHKLWRWAAYRHPKKRRKWINTSTFGSRKD